MRDAVARAGERLKSEGCAAAISGLLSSSFRELSKDFEKLDAEEQRYIDDHINKNMTAGNVSKILTENEKNFKIEYNNPNLKGNNTATSATFTEVGDVMTFTLYGGFFRKFNKGGSLRTDEKGRTTVNRRAMTLIHEGIHAVSPDFSDELVGRIAAGKLKKPIGKNFSKSDGSQMITAFVMEHCMPKN